MNGSAKNSEQMKVVGRACFRFWFDDAKDAERLLVTRFDATDFPLSITYEGLEFALREASDGMESLQYVGTNPIDLPEGPTLELVFVQGGAASATALIKAMTGLAAEIVRAAHSRAVAWVPAATVTGAEFFTRVADTWMGGGAFPAMVLVALRGDGDGLVTRGLDLFCGQEMTIELAPMPMPEQAKVAIRMIDHLVTEGPVTENEIVEVDGFGSFEIGARDSGKNIYLRRSPFP